jgi:hypothetical protein
MRSDSQVPRARMYFLFRSSNSSGLTSGGGSISCMPPSARTATGTISSTIEVSRTVRSTRRQPSGAASISQPPIQRTTWSSSASRSAWLGSGYQMELVRGILTLLSRWNRWPRRW